MKNFVLIIFSFVLLVPVNYAQKKVLPIDLQIGYGLPRKPFVDFGVYLGQSQRHRIGIGANYRIPINLFEDFNISSKSFSPLLFFHLGVYDGPGAFIHYEKLLGNNNITLGAKAEFAKVQSKSYWKGSNQCLHCVDAHIYNATFTVGIPVDRRGIFNIHSDAGITLMHGLSTRRSQSEPWGPVSYKHRYFFMGGLYLQVSLRVKVVGFNTGVAQNR